MTQKERRLIHELIAIGAAAIGLALTIPALISAHDTIALFAAGLLAVGWFGWALYYLYRVSHYVNKKENK
jgi:hypothetical protein